MRLSPAENLRRPQNGLHAWMRAVSPDVSASRQLSSSRLSVADYESVVDALLARAKAGDEKSVYAIARLLDQPSARPAPSEDEQEGGELGTWEDMTLGQRAVARARILRCRMCGRP
jgi:hypothetical protein